MLHKLRKLVETMEEVKEGDGYWEIQKAFKEQLGKFIEDPDELLELSGPEVLEVVKMCSDHRPFPAHVILMNIGAAHKKLTSS